LIFTIFANSGQIINFKLNSAKNCRIKKTRQNQAVNISWFTGAAKTFDVQKNVSPWRVRYWTQPWMKSLSSALSTALHECIKINLHPQGNCLARGRINKEQFNPLAPEDF
jgi:hypothetical protein